MRMTAVLTALCLATGFANAEFTHVEHNDVLLTNTMYGRNYDFPEFMRLVRSAYRKCNLTDCVPKNNMCDRLFCISMDAKITGLNNSGDTYTSAFQVFGRAGTFKDNNTKVCEPDNAEKCHVDRSTTVTVPQRFNVNNRKNEKKEIFRVEFVASINDKPPMKKGKEVPGWVNYGERIQSTCGEMENVFVNVTKLIHPANRVTFGPITVGCKGEAVIDEDSEW